MENYQTMGPSDGASPGERGQSYCLHSRGIFLPSPQCFLPRNVSPELQAALCCYPHVRSYVGLVGFNYSLSFERGYADSW